MGKITQTIVCVVFMLYAGMVKSQLSGNYTIPGNYSSIAAAINDLNTYGVGGPVVFNVAAGYTETAVSGGYTLNAIAGASSGSPVTFQKSGSGANPLVVAYTGGVNTPSNAVQDGVWRFMGTDYVTINGLDILDPNTTNPATMEFGYGFFKAGPTDGCQYNTISNCTITLNRANNIAGTGPAVDGSRGINVANATNANFTTAVTVVSASGSNSYNKFYGNTIQNCNYGIALIGYADVSPFTYADYGNDVGGSSAFTGNNILNYGGGGTISPAAAVRTLAQYNLNVSFNVINNNNGAGVSHATVLRGIYLNTATSANAAINNNTLTLNNGGTTSQVSVIENASGSTAAGNTIDIKNNLITACTNSVNTTGAFYGIYNSASSQNLNIIGNVFSGNTSNATSGTTYMLYNSGTVPGNITLSNNSLSHSFNNATTAYSGSMYNIYNSGGAITTTLAIVGNSFSNYSFVNVTGSSSLYFIYNTVSCSTNSICANTWNNLSLNHSSSEYLIYNSTSTQNLLSVLNNSIVTAYTRLGAAGTMYCYYSGSSSLANSSQVFSGNNFSNITATVSGSGTFYGIYTSDGTSPYPRKTISNNTISNITYSTSGTAYAMYVANFGDGISSQASAINNNLISGITTAGTLYGLYVTTGTSPNYPPSVYQNTVGVLTSNGASSSVYGAYLATGYPGMNFYKNKIHTLTENGATGTAYGMYISGGTNANYYNNIVGNINTPASSSSSAINGIYINSGTLLNLYYNTVYLNATSTGGAFGCNAIYASTSPTVVLRNNIFVNASTAGATGIVAAYRRSSTTLATYAGSSNNNLFYAGTPSATNVIYHDGTTAYQTLTSFKTLMAGMDQSSITENPSFAATTGSLSNFLFISTTLPTQIESAGAPVTGISDDYQGSSRNATQPDIGAVEGSYLPSGSDLVPPFASGMGFSSSACNTLSRTFTVSLSDLSGIASGSLAPKVYYKVNAGSYASATGTLLSGTVYSGVWSFNMTYSATTGDVISYYLVAQDQAGTSNLLATPVAGFSGTDVNTISANPTTPLVYSVGASLNGVYTVGSAATFTTLTAAVNAYNNGCLTGPVTFSLTDALYSTNETYPLVFQNNLAASATNALLIRPASGVSVALTPVSTTITSVIKFLNARYITFDGVNSGGSMMTVNNTNSTTTSANIWMASTTLVGPGCKNITFKNATINGGSNAYSNGFVASADGTSPSGTAGLDNDNVTLTGNTLANLYNGVLAVGLGTLSAGGLDNWNISNNTFGPATIGATSFAGSGIVLSGALNSTLTSNVIQNLSTASSAVYAINLNQAVNGFVVSSNTISNIFSSGSTSGINAVAALYMGPGVVNGSVNSNSMTTIVNTSTGGWGVRGMIINTGSSNSNINIRNNFISDVYCYADVNYIYWPIAIDIEGMSGGLNIDNNTINMFGSHPGYSSGVTGSALVYIGTSYGSINLRNNIFSTSFDNSTSTTELNYAIYNNMPASVFSTMNYNDYYVGGTGNVPTFGYLGGTALSTLSSFQAAFGQNANSVNMQPAFTSTADLHVLASSSANYLLDNLGTPISGITTDIDGQTRSGSVPDMGADEFTSTAACSTPLGGTVATSAYTICSTQTLGLVSTGFSAGANTNYQWQVSTVSGSGYTNVASGTGANTPAYKTPLLPGGTYYYVLKTTCTTNSTTAVSNEVTVSVGGLSTPSITSTPSIICVSGTATLTASGATSYTWNNGATSSSIVVTPLSSFVYNVTGTSPGCGNATSSNFNLFYSLNPTVTAVAVTPVICSGSPATLTASGAATYSWSDGETSGSANPSPSVTTNYTVTGYYANGCNSSAVQSVSVNPRPVITISGASGLCNGQTANLTASGATSYTWNTGDLTSAISATPATTTTYSVVGVNAFGCASTATQVVNVAASLSISIVGPSTICVGQSAALTGNGGVTYTWSTGSSSSTIAPSPSVTTTYSIIGASGTCSNSAVKTVSVNTNPVVSITGNSVICVGKTTTLTAGGAASYTWSTAQASTAIFVSPTVNTTYTVSGLNVAGCSATAAISVVSNSLPVIAITSSSTSVCPLTTVTLTSSGAATYTWNTGTVSAATAVTPSANTVYTVTGTNALGCVSASTVALSTYSLPVLTITPASSTVCSLSQANLTASGASTYSWTNNGSNAALSVNPASSTIYTLTGTSSQGCVSTSTAAVITMSLPVMSITPANATICALSPVTFTASGALSYNWSSGSQQAASLVYPAASTIYSVQGTNAQGCSSSATVAVSTLSTPVLVVTPSLTSLCLNETSTFSVNGASTYTWQGGSNSASIVLSSSVAALAYSVSGTAPNGCVASEQVYIFTNPLPTVAIVASSATVCSMAPVHFTATGANSYNWSTNATTSVVIVNPSATTVYTVTGTYTTTGCFSSATVAVVTKPLPVLTVSPASPSICYQSAIDLTASGASTYTWSTATKHASLTLAPLATTDYTVTGTDVFGCSNSTTVSIVVNALPVIAVTPSMQTICKGNSGMFNASGAMTYTLNTTSSNSNSFQVTPTSNTTYTVYGTDANTCQNSALVTVLVSNCTGIDKATLSDVGVRVFPNPSRGIFTTEFGFEGHKTLVVLDAIGQTVYRLSSTANSEVIDISNLAKGVYFVKISATAASGTYRIVID